MAGSVDTAIVLGTRPEIIKLAPIIRECDTLGLEYRIIHTGQHYSENLDQIFFDQLDLSTPDHNLDVGSGPHGAQTAEMIAGIESLVLEIEPDVVLVQGDTNSVLAGAIATSKLDADLGHVEAGLRSFDRTMPEETNRVLTDHVADYLFAPTDKSAQLLRQEGIPDERIEVTGNTVVDAVYQNQELAAEKSSILETLSVTKGEFALMTAHRAENVDDRARYRGMLTGAAKVSRELDCEIVYPLHPRAKDRLDEFNLTVPEPVRLIEPLDYLDFLRLESEAAIVLTDSGGVQEEACILGIPCVTMRENTERPETIDVGANVLVGTEADDILEGVKTMIDRPIEWTNPFGDGTAAEQILTSIRWSESHPGVVR